MDALSSSFLTSLPLPPPAAKLLIPRQQPLSLSCSLVDVPQTTDKLHTKPPSSQTITPRPSNSALTTKPLPPSPAATNLSLTTTNATRQRPAPSLPITIFNAVDGLINTFIDPPLRPSVDPRHVLSANFAPVDELPPTECQVVHGSLPPCLDGAYIRNGPNPQFLPRGPYHLFDGDGMLHSLRISAGRAVLCSRYVQTHKYLTERDLGSPVLPNVFSGFNSLTSSAFRGALSAVRIISGQFNPADGIGLANTSLALFGGKLFALGESDLPYSIRLTPTGDIKTIGRHDFDGKLFMSMTAHPKIDPETGDAFAFRYGPMPPFLTFFYFDKDGNKQSDVPIFSMTSPSFIHDFSITKNYAIFADIQIGMNPMDMIFGGGSPVRADPGKIPRIGVIPRYAKDESKIKWLEVPGFNPVHLINSWEEDDGETIVILAPNILSVEHTLDRLDLVHASVEMVRINLRTNLVTRKPISASNLDFAVVNPDYVAKKSRFVYAGIGVPMPKITGIAKLDVSKGEGQECTVARRMFGQGCYGGEPFFVARDPTNAAAEEDDGYIVSYVHDENSGESRLLVMDAKSPELELVAAVRLPRRVPYGFHGLFVRESDLKQL